MLHCPVCSEAELAKNEIVSDLIVFTCPQCEGDWLRFDHYLDWHDSFGDNLPQQSDTPEEYSLETFDTLGAKQCPDCQLELSNCKIHSALDFGLDYCQACNGVWFDKNEFEVLKSVNLHLEVHHFFTETWQKRQAPEVRAAYLETYYSNKFGSHAYDKVKEFKQWLQDNEHKSSMLVYLLKQDKALL